MTVPRLYIDSAEDQDVTRLLATGIPSGVTTNPTILRRAGVHLGDLPRLYARWTEAGAGEVFFQSWGGTADELVEHGLRLAGIGPRVVVKIPATAAGFAATTRVVGAGHPVLLTAVYSAGQALVAAAVGARYIAPYLGRLDDAGLDGRAAIARMQRLLEGCDTRILAASLRDVEAVTALADLGVRHVTARPAVLEALLADDLAGRAAAVFEQDALACLDD
jgi:transaldolase